MCIRDRLNLQTRNQAKEEDACVMVPLEDALKGPGHVAWKLIQDTKEQSTDSFVFNDEQILLIALCVWPLEQAWRAHMKKQQNVRATVDTLQRWMRQDQRDAKSGSSYSADFLPQSCAHCAIQSSSTRVRS